MSRSPAPDLQENFDHFQNSCPWPAGKPLTCLELLVLAWRKTLNNQKSWPSPHPDLPILTCRKISYTVCPELWPVGKHIQNSVRNISAHQIFAARWQSSSWPWSRLTLSSVLAGTKLCLLPWFSQLRRWRGVISAVFVVGFHTFYEPSPTAHNMCEKPELRRSLVTRCVISPTHTMNACCSNMDCGGSCRRKSLLPA